MNRRTIVITGNDTGVGKTVLTAALANYLVTRAVPVAALKPICSGGREDAHALHAALCGALSLDEVNPWHFRAALAPVLAARRERRRVTLHEVAGHVRTTQRRFPLTLVESAGGLLSPLGEGFDTRDLIAALGAEAVIVCPNRLGAVNQVRLVLAALPAMQQRNAHVVLVSPPRPDAAGRTNAALLAEFMKRERLHSLPWQHSVEGYDRTRWRRALRSLAATLQLV